TEKLYVPHKSFCDDTRLYTTDCTRLLQLTTRPRPELHQTSTRSTPDLQLHQQNLSNITHHTTLHHRLHQAPSHSYSRPTPDLQQNYTRTTPDLQLL
ncbi:hypothetical protein WMY93_034289, partial [Mugilogobius chulae]